MFKLLVYSISSSDGQWNNEDIIDTNRLQADAQERKPDVSQLPSETIEFAHRMFEAARKGDSVLLLSAVDSGLPANLTNDKGFIPALW